MKKVFIGAGHGGTDSGAIGRNGLKEKDLNLSIARACGDSNLFNTLGGIER